MVDTEVQLLRRLRHSNIVRLFDFWDMPGRYYLSMEFVQGGDLFEALQQNRCYAEYEAAALMENLISALDYLHALNIVHRDVKPENLLVKFYFKQVFLFKFIKDFNFWRKAF